MGEKTSFYKSDQLDKILAKYVDRYGSVSKAITSLVLGVDTIYRIERRVLRELFSQAEIDLMVNNALSTQYLPQATAGAVLADTEDEAQAIFDLYEVDKAVLLEKLRGLTLSQQYTLVDWLMELRGAEPPEPEE